MITGANPRFASHAVEPKAVAAWLGESGFRPDLAMAVIERSPLRLREGQWLHWGGSLHDKAAVILRVLGRPCDTRELAVELSGDYSEQSIRNALYSSPQIMRVGKTAVALREWGLEEYSGISDEIAQRIERAGGAADLDCLVTELATTFGVAGSSVRAYAGAPRFVLEAGTVRLRTADEPYKACTRTDAAKGLFLDPGRGLVHLVVDVDRDTERGSGKTVSQAVATALGIAPGHSATFVGPGGGSLSMTWPVSSSIGPSIGSTRSLARGAGAKIGDGLRVSFDLARREVSAQRICATTTDLGVLTGLEVSAGRELELIGSSIGCSPEMVRDVLERRGDHQLLNSLPNPRIDEHLEVAMSSLTDILREP